MLLKLARTSLNWLAIKGNFALSNVIRFIYYILCIIVRLASKDDQCVSTCSFLYVMRCTLHVIYSMAKNGKWLNIALVSSIISHYECYTGLGLITIVIKIDCNRVHFLCNHNRNHNHTFSKLYVIVIMLCNHV